MSDELFDSAKQLRMRERFASLTKQPSISPLSEQGKLHDRLDKLRSKQAAHFERHSPIWLQKELSKLILKHKGQLQPTLSPRYVLQTETSPAALAKRAMNNVEIRKQARMDRVEKIGARMLEQAKLRDEQKLRNKKGPAI